MSQRATGHAGPSQVLPRSPRATGAARSFTANRTGHRIRLHDLGKGEDKMTGRKKVGGGGETGSRKEEWAKLAETSRAARPS